MQMSEKISFSRIFGTLSDIGKYSKRLKWQCINSHNQICLICGKYIPHRQRSYHHICRVPPIRVMLHKDCHKELELEKTNKYKHLKPNYSIKEIKCIRKARHKKSKILKEIM